MCTVSFISIGNKTIITSNRDEQTTRPKAYEPKEEIINDFKIIYPKDPKAGGTWFAIKENGMAAVLLNGAFKNHIPDEKHTVSRGLILLRIISGTDPISQVSKIDLGSVAPFTIVLFNTKRLIEFRWDGNNKHIKELDARSNYIWSSVTLYAKDAILKREAQFADFLEGSGTIHEKSIINFHLDNDNDFENGFIINRNDEVKTFSISQAVFEAEEIAFNHLDLVNNINNSMALPINNITKQFL
ncbi:NRDE family protein [Flavobacteriaceae bacterium KMM 6898]|nr:NRDE family protein [Flavobacteriaceae bacterium KMM 6898]